MRAVLYRIFDRDERLLYVGITTNGVGRWAQHSLDQPWWPTVATVRVQHCDSLAEAAYLEREAIANERPLHNQIHNTPKMPRYPHRAPGGRGTVFQRSNGRWVAAISEGSRETRRRQYRTASTRGEAERSLRELLAAKARGTP